MPVNQWNKDFTHPQVIKWDGTNIDQVRAALEIVYARVPDTDLILPAAPVAVATAVTEEVKQKA
jgi:hypothetical protein